MADTLSSLSANDLSLRLHALAGEERAVQADFLLHLDELDRRRSFLELGYPSLWEFCLRALHLREGAAARRIGAMRVLRRLPGLEGALRDGRLCLSTMSLLSQVLTAENLDDLVSRSAFKTKAEVDAIVASVKPRHAPADGIRRLPGTPPALLASLDARPRSEPPPVLLVSVDAAATPAPASIAPPRDRDGEQAQPIALRDSPHEPRPPELRAISADQWSLRVTLDAEAKADLEALTVLLAHKNPKGDLAAVLEEALRCGIEKHGKRRGAVPPAAKRARKPRTTPAEPAPIERRSAAAATPTVTALVSLNAPETAPAPALRVAPSPSGRIPADVRRKVWERDGGRCTFTASDGTRCGSRWKLELDHVVPKALGGQPTVDGLRLRCRGHNLLHAEEVFGRDHMDLFRRGDTARLNP